MGRLSQLFVLAAALVGAVAGVQKVHQKDMMVLGYWTDWTNDVYPAKAIPWKKLTHVNYAFIVFGEDFVMQTSCDSTFSVPKNCTNGHKILKDLVDDGHTHGVKMQASVGGWDGSQFFSYAVGSPSNVTKVVNNFVKLVKDFNLDGIDIDWEYPGRAGMACNVMSPGDSAGLLVLLKALRTAFDKNFGKSHKTISMAVPIQTFANAQGNYMSDVRIYAEYLNWINMMTYDLNGPWDSNAAPNGPLYNIPGKGEDASIALGVKNWVSAGMPKNKIVIGTPWYSHSFLATAVPTVSDFYVPISPNTPKGDWNDIPVADPCPGQVPAYSGQWKWKNYFLQKVLKNPTTAIAPWERHFDPVTQTPWMYNHETKIINMYDDPVSLKSKAMYARCEGYRGTMVWSLDMDYKDMLLDALQETRNIKGKCHVAPAPK